MKRLIGRWLRAGVMGVAMLGSQLACSGDKPQFAFHSFMYDPAVDMPQVELLDCLYGTGLGAHTQQEVDAGQARRGECITGGGSMPIGDFLYVKWRDKASGKEYEDRVDLRKRLPSPKEMDRTTIYFLIDENQLYVYLVPREEWDTKLNHRPEGKPANGPEGSQYLDVRTLYPDNAPPKVRGGGSIARAKRAAAEGKQP